MKIAIHKKNKSEGTFRNRWVRYCETNNIPYKIVSAYDSDIVEQLKDCTAFMWHFEQGDYRDMLFAKSLLISCQTKGMKVFPDINTMWHFDDKVAQKYLLESIEAPLVPSYVFYTKKTAYDWIDKTTFPKVFKLKGGSGSTNVRLVHSKKMAHKLVNIAFGKGFCQHRRLYAIKETYRQYKNKKASFLQVLNSFRRAIFLPEFAKMHSNEKGYAYFQDFIPNNTYDIRICIVDNKAFALKRFVRKNDFRASGSGHIVYDKQQIDERCVKIAFEVNDKLKTQSIAYDFVFDKKNNPLIVEISYGYATTAYDKCEGYWDREMNWHKGENFDFCGWMVEEVR